MIDSIRLMIRLIDDWWLMIDSFIHSLFDFIFLSLYVSTYSTRSSALWRTVWFFFVVGINQSTIKLNIVLTYRTVHYVLYFIHYIVATFKLKVLSNWATLRYHRTDRGDRGLTIKIFNTKTSWIRSSPIRYTFLNIKGTTSEIDNCCDDARRYSKNWCLFVKKLRLPSVAHKQTAFSTSMSQ